MWIETHDEHATPAENQEFRAIVLSVSQISMDNSARLLSPLAVVETNCRCSCVWLIDWLIDGKLYVRRIAYVFTSEKQRFEAHCNDKYTTNSRDTRRQSAATDRYYALVAKSSKASSYFLTHYKWALMYCLIYKFAAILSWFRMTR